MEPTIVMRILVFSSYSLCLSLNIFRFLYIIFRHVKIAFKTKQWELQWYYYLDVVIYCLCSYSLYYWFLNLAKRETFVLPFEDESDFELWNDNRIFIRNFFTVAPIAVVFLCFKNV